jgi:hypothetical protein
MRLGAYTSAKSSLRQADGSRASHVRETPKLEGSWMIVELFAGDLGDVIKAGGFTSFRRVAQTPFNILYEARP